MESGSRAAWTGAAPDPPSSGLLSDARGGGRRDDRFFTGTPHGVILGKPKAEQVWLKAGDRVVCSVEKLGELAFSLT